MINPVSSYYVNQQNIANKKVYGGKTRTEANVAKDARSDAAVGDDTIVSLSDTSKDIQAARSAVNASPDARLEKVDALKTAVNQGDYTVDAEKVAEKMLLAIDEYI